MSGLLPQPVIGLNAWAFTLGLQELPGRNQLLPA